MKNKLFSIEIFAICVTSILLIYILMIKPIVGVADSGDFQRIMGSVGLDYVDAVENYKDKYFGFIHRKYKLKNIEIQGYTSTQIPLVILAAALNKIVSSHTVFDIRFLAFVYGIIFLIPIYFIIKLNKQKNHTTNWILLLLFVFVFADVGYISYFNSLFGEPVSFTFLFLTIGLSMHLTKQTRPTVWLLLCFFAAALFLVGAKAQNAPIGVFIAILGIRLGWLKEGKKWRGSVAVLSLFLVVISMITYSSVPQQFRIANQYQSVFYGILKDSPTPEKDLEELGINRKFAVLANTNYFTPDTPIRQQDPILQKEFYPKISPRKVALFYLTHPLRYLEKLKVTASNGMYIRPGYSGNYEKTDHVEYGKKANYFDFWSDFKKNVLPHSLILVVLFFAAYFTVWIAKYVQAKSVVEKIYLEIFALIGLIGIIAFVVPILGDGEADLGKHLFLFNVCFDMMWVASIVWLVNNAATFFIRRGRLSE